MRMMPVFIYSNRMLLLIFVSLAFLSIFIPLNFIYSVSNEQLRGKTPVEQAQVLQWIEYGEREINPASATLVYPCMGIMQFSKQNNERAKDELKHVLSLLNNYLRTKTYLVSERITLADVAVACDLLLLFQWVRKARQIIFVMFKLCFIRLSIQVYANLIHM
jgi:glutathionyl-hydroquinone reductase